MEMQRRRRVVYSQIAWMVGVILALALLGALTLEVFFVASFVGFLALLELTAPVNVAPAWRARLKWIVLLGLLGFGYLLVQMFLEILPDGLL